MIRSSLVPTASQTAGPFLAIGLRPLERTHLVPEDATDAVVLAGRVLDGAGDPVPDAVVELWQADRGGRLGTGTDDAGMPQWFGRCLTDDGGRYRFVTAKPGALARPAGTEAPHLELLVFARGLLRPVRTRVYFPDEREPNASDPVLSRVPADRRQTLVARQEGDSLVFDIHLQGRDETVFFAC